MIHQWQDGHTRFVLVDRWEDEAQQRIWLDWLYDHGVPDGEADQIPMGTAIACDDLARTLTYTRMLLDHDGFPRISDDRTELLVEEVIHQMESPALPFPQRSPK